MLLINCGDLNVDFLIECNEKSELFNSLLSYNLKTQVDTTHITSHSNTYINNFKLNNSLVNFKANNFSNALPYHMQLVVILVLDHSMKDNERTQVKW